MKKERLNELKEELIIELSKLSVDDLEILLGQTEDTDLRSYILDTIETKLGFEKFDEWLIAYGL